ncbi:MAG: SH3 domain-containing protein [Christensenellaceae bacterium]|nr:SH3 domain-containing protein [Christensenellaceae bacterium]
MKKLLALTLCALLCVSLAAPVFAAELPGTAAAIVLPRGLNLRAGPGLGNSVIRVLPRGTELAVLSVDGVWAQVDAGNGLLGYVHIDYIAWIGEAPQDEEEDVAAPAADSPAESRVLSQPKVAIMKLAGVELESAVFDAVKDIYGDPKSAYEYYELNTKQGGAAGDQYLLDAIEKKLSDANQSYASEEDLKTALKTVTGANFLELLKLLAAARNQYIADLGPN